MRKISDSALQFVDETQRGFTWTLIQSCLDMRDYEEEDANDCLVALISLLARLLPNSLEKLMKKALKYSKELNTAPTFAVFFQIIEGCVSYVLCFINHERT